MLFYTSVCACLKGKCFLIWNMVVTVYTSTCISFFYVLNLWITRSLFKLKKKWCFVSLHGEVFQLPAIKCFKTCFLAHRSTWASPGLNGIKDTWGCRCNTPDLVFCRSNQSVFCLIWNWFRAGTCSYECRVKRNGHSIGFALFF